MTTLHIEQVQKAYGSQMVIQNLSLTIQSGEFLTLLGASGSGKTTLLRMLAGLERADAGVIRFDDAVVQDERHFLPPQARGLGMVFQNYALWPHLNVADNLALALKNRRIPRNDIHQRVIEALKTVGLDHLAHRAIHQLSGGQQQRVALARALVTHPQVLLMDEPLSNLDAELRAQLRDEIRALQQQLGITTVFVTHDQTEALAISDRIALLHHGCLIELGAPEALYHQPKSEYAAQFLGKANLLSGEIVGANRVRIGRTELTMPTNEAPMGTIVQCLIRPQALQWATTETENTIPVAIQHTKMLGAAREYSLLAETLASRLIFTECSSLRPQAGNCAVYIPPHSIQRLDA